VGVGGKGQSKDTHCVRRKGRQKADRRTRIAILPVEYSGRSFRADKTVISAELSIFFDRLGCWAVTSRRNESACANSRAAWESITSRTRADAQRDKATPRFV